MEGLWRKIKNNKIVKTIDLFSRSIFTALKRIYRKRRFLKNLAFFCIGAFVLFTSVAIIYLSSLKIPDFQYFEERKVTNSTKIYDRTGEIILYDIHQDIKRTDIPFEEMGVNIKNATVAIEDSEFYNHNGIKIKAIARAILSNIFTTGPTQGGSTITQQLVKNTLLTQKVTYTRKIKEWVLAIKIDRALPKDKILEYYLNEAPYGGTVYGIKEASRTYFSKDPIDLSLAEAAYLAAIPQSPTLLSPYRKNTEKLEARKNLVLARMLELNFIGQEEYEGAKAEVVAFTLQYSQGIKAPHFVFFIKDYLEEKYGAEVAEKGGLKVTTTLDWALQEKGEGIVKEGALENEQSWNGENAGLVAIDPKTGQILTMIGSRDYFDKNIDGNFNVATAHRQPGSSFKPFIYATAFNKGFTPATVLFDLPTEFQTTCDASGRALPGRSQTDCYKPDNYDGKFRGPMSLRDALAQSINIPAVKLLYLSGLRDSLKTAEDMGISTLTDPSRYGLTLVIGGGEVSLLDMTSAYSVFANSGIKNPYTGILKIEDASGNIIEEYAPKEEEVLPKNTALTISEILSDEEARIPTFGARSALYIPGRVVVAKTGTTNSNKDAWTLGYTPSLSVGVWVGNNDNTPMKKGGAALAGPIWNKFMTEALKEMPDEGFEEPDWEIDPQTVKPALRGVWQGNNNFFIDKVSGKLAGEFTPPETIEEKVVTEVHTILYWVDRKNITGPTPQNPQSDPQFSHWEIPVQNWWAQNRSKYSTTTLSEMPTETDDVHTGEVSTAIKILEPDPKRVYPRDKKINLKVSSVNSFDVEKMDIFINNIYLDTIQKPFNFSFTPSHLDDLKVINELRVVARDKVFNRSEATINFEVEEE